jgi:hypothetical protein
MSGTLFLRLQMSQPTYKYSDNYVASFHHLRQLKTSSDATYLPKTGGVISNPIYETTQADGNRLATRQYVLDNAGTGGSGGQMD